MMQESLRGHAPLGPQWDHQQLAHNVQKEADFHQGQLVWEEAHRQAQGQVQCSEPCDMWYPAE